MKPIETVIFDMDGVIIDSEPIHMKIQQEIFCKLGVEMSEREHQNYVGTSSDEFWAAIIEKYQVDASAGELFEMKQQRYLQYLKSQDQLTPLDGVIELIDDISHSGKKLLVASSATTEEIRLVLERLQISSYFSHIVSGAELQRSKPDPEIFLKAATLSQTRPERCCVIEDSANGVEAAVGAGMKCIGFRNLNSGRQDLSKSDIIISDFREANMDQILNDLSR